MNYGKLIEQGYKVWEAGDKKRIYINDFAKYIVFDADENVNACQEKAKLIANGIDYSNANLWKKRRVYSEKLFGNKMYYDFADDKIHFTVANEFEMKLMQTIVEKINAELTEKTIEEDEEMGNLFTQGLQAEDELLFNRYAYVSEQDRKNVQELDEDIELTVDDCWRVWTEGGIHIADVEDVSELLNR